MGKLDYIKIKNFCSSRDTIEKVKRQSTEWKKIFVTHVKIIFRIYSGFLKNFYCYSITVVCLFSPSEYILKINKKKYRKPNRKMGRRFEQTFHKKNIQIASKQMKNDLCC